MSGKSYGALDEEIGSNSDVLGETSLFNDADLRKNEDIHNLKMKIVRYVVLAISIAIIGFIAISSATDNTLFLKTGKASSLTKSKSTRSDSDLSFTFTRSGYAPILDFSNKDVTPLRYATLSDVDGVIEPHADMFLYIKSGDLKGSYYSFDVVSDKDTAIAATGYLYPTDSTQNVAVKLSCTPYETFAVTVNQYGLYDNRLLATTTGTAKCLYVRREIRALSESDLNTFMDAMATLWYVDEDTGKGIYGETYTSAQSLLEMHFFQASWLDADHSHEGRGFVSSHIIMTNIMEISLQLIDPSISMPYWDFTIESATGLSIAESPMYTADTFGSLAIAETGWSYETNTVLDGAIQDGRFAFLKIHNNTRFPQFKRAYGLMRAPWSTNPSPYISRYTSTSASLPTCASHKTVLKETMLSSFLVSIANDPHASTHMMTAGSMGCELLDPLINAGHFDSADDALSLCHYLGKYWYRNKLLSLATDCYVENNDYSSYKNFKCGYECDQTDEGISKLNTKLRDYVADGISDVGLADVRSFLCGGDAVKVIVGDMFDSSSAGDPAFWPIHPTLERLLHVKMFMGGFEDNTYPTADNLQSVCTQYECYNYKTDIYQEDITCCEGHFADSRLFDFYHNDRESHIGPTIIETLSSTNASSSSYNMPYIYDSFEWPHCAGLGEESSDIDELVDQYTRK